MRALAKLVIVPARAIGHVGPRAVDANTAVDAASRREVIEHAVAAQPSDHAIISVANDRGLERETKVASGGAAVRRQLQFVRAIRRLGKAVAIEIERKAIAGDAHVRRQQSVRQRDPSSRDNFSKRVGEASIAWPAVFVQLGQRERRRARIDAGFGKVALAVDIGEGPRQEMRVLFPRAAGGRRIDEEERGKHRKLPMVNGDEMRVDVPPLCARRIVRQILRGQVDGTGPGQSNRRETTDPGTGRHGNVVCHRVTTLRDCC